MACKKSELAQAINTYTSARVSGDPNLINFASQLLTQYLDTLEYDAEEEAVEPTEEPASDS